ncbi:hypothetical protein AB0K92_15855 [Streptomyces sp. NPDC052687]|uniref:hypothetical protein n=1 Tax=Streptomyces sp. NPDC052687 TaxID=3154759 RepID=UPI003430881D
MDSNSAALEAHDAFRVTISGIWSEVIAGRMSDDDGWAAVGDALTELRDEVGQ